MKSYYSMHKNQNHPLVIEHNQINSQLISIMNNVERKVKQVLAHVG